MNKVKAKLLVRVILLVGIIFSIIMISFNLYMQQYIRRAANDAVETKLYDIRYAAYYNQFLDNTSAQTLTIDNITNNLNLYSFYEQNELKNGLVTVNAFYINNSYNISKVDWSNHKNEKESITEIVDYCENNLNTLDTYKCYTAKVGNKEYCFAQLSGKELIYNNDINYDKSVYDNVIIIYANTKPIERLIKKINLVFIIILVTVGIVAILITFYIGNSISNSQEQMKEFYQNVSHELKTPIMNIQGYSEGIMTDVIKNHREASEVILSESERMSDLVQEMLLMSMLDSGQLTVKHDKIDIKEILYFICNRAQLSPSKKSIEIQTEFTQDKCVIIGDEVKIEKAFTNIMTNALRYAHSQITVKCTKEKNLVCVEISDDGNGISKQDMPHIFERYYKGKGGVNGIGLSLTKEILKKHRGKINVHNKCGACFNIEIKGLRK